MCRPTACGVLNVFVLLSAPPWVPFLAWLLVPVLVPGSWLPLPPGSLAGLPSGRPVLSSLGLCWVVTVHHADEDASTPWPHWLKPIVAAVLSCTSTLSEQLGWKSGLDTSSQLDLADWIRSPTD